MSLTATTIASAISATDQKFNLTSGTGVEVGDILRVNDEFMKVQGFDSPKVTVQRGIWGTNAIAHGILSIAVHGYPYEFAPRPKPRLYTYGEAGAITLAPGIHRLIAASGAAMTLAAPTADMEGEEILIIAGAAQAYTVTGSYNNAGSTVATFAAAIGNCIKLVVINGYWCVTLNKNITLT